MEPALSLASADSLYGSAYGHGGLYAGPGDTMSGGMHPGRRAAGAGGGEEGYASGYGEECGSSGGRAAATAAGRRPAQLLTAMREVEVGRGAGEGCFAVGNPDFEFQLPAFVTLQNSPSAEPMAGLLPLAAAAAAVAGSDIAADCGAFAAPRSAATTGQAGAQGRRNTRGRGESRASRGDKGAQALAPASPEEWFPGPMSVSSTGVASGAGGGGGSERHLRGRCCRRRRR